MSFAQGTLAGTYSGSATANDDGTATFAIDVAITSGSGIFAGAIETLSFTGDITQITPRPFMVFIVVGTYVDSSSVPEPNTLTLRARRRLRGSRPAPSTPQGTAPSIGPSVMN